MAYPEILDDPESGKADLGSGEVVFESDLSVLGSGLESFENDVSHPGSDVIENFLMFLFSPSGCTFWGKKPWSRKKKLLWQLGTLAGAPLGIAVVAGVALPALLVGLPLWAGRRAHRRLRRATPARRRAAVAAAVAAAVSTHTVGHSTHTPQQTPCSYSPRAPPLEYVCTYATATVELYSAKQIMAF